MMAQKNMKELAKTKIQDKIAAYEALKKSDRYESISEPETCSKFIKPLFEALGWDTTGERILDEVTEQDPAGGLKRVDYAFNINSSPVMYLEAKKLSVDLDDPSFARQAINYGYSKSVKWVILTDFEGIIVFNSLLKTKRNSERIVLKLSYTEYLDKLDDLWLLSKESIVNGELDKHARTKGHIVNKVPINEILLTKLLVWRNQLIKKITSDNEGLSKEEVAECVQRLLNRLIFIRTCEDRKIDKHKLLLNLTKDWGANPDKWLHKMLQAVFRDFGEGYDSSLFEKHLVDSIKIDGGLLYKVIIGLYEDPGEDVEFDFAVIDADILGSIYEQYLGTIQKGEGAKDKEKRKSHGIYYTPKYIVDYIVKNTLGKVLDEMLKNKEYAKIGKLKVLDPACGSGSFLLKALELFDDAYEKTPEFAKLPKGRKIKALCNNIYGVDLDTEAVELTKLNLLLSSTYSRKKLPNLNDNIEQGNSLIDDPKIAGDKAFDWDKRFKDVMDKGRFDVVIGNPPWVTLLHQEIGQKVVSYYKEKFIVAEGFKLNLFPLFLEKALRLVKNGGLISFILPNRLLDTPSYENLRKHLICNYTIEHIIDIPQGSFDQVVAGNIIIIIKNEKNPSNKPIKVNRNIFEEGRISFSISIKDIIANDYAININRAPGADKLTDKIQKNSISLKQTMNVHVGMMIKEKKNKLTRSHVKGLKRIVVGRDFDRYTPMQYRYFDPKKVVIFGGTKRPSKHEVRHKILLRKTGNTLIASYDSEGIYAEQSVYLLLPNSEKTSRIMFLLGLINSRLLSFYFRNILITNPEAYPYIQHYDVEKLPIYNINLKNNAEKTKYDAIIKLVTKMLMLTRQYSKIKDKLTYETERLKRQIEETDKEIDQLVYKLYGLTKEEIRVVEGEK